MAKHYDVIIIGSGAGGGTMARALAPTGKEILILERGGFVPRERENSSSQAVAVEKRYAPQETWYFDDRPFRPSHPHYYVGGSTKLYGAAMIRLRERDFEQVEHAGGISPAWPISYADLEPYYLEAEKWYYVHGEAGIDPTEPQRSQSFPYPPLEYEPRIQQLHDDLKRLGYHPFPLPMGVKLGYEDGEPGPVTSLNLISQFDGYPDPTESKADAHVVGIKYALKHDNVTLKTHSYVERLETDNSGRRVTGVVVKKEDGANEIYTADWVIVAAGAINSAALFLRSKNDKHPNGLANSSGLVGRNYMSHNNATFLAISKEVNDSLFQKTLALADFYWGDDEWRYPMGFIQMLGKVDEVLMKYESPQPLEGMSYAEMAQHSLDFWLQSEDLPDPNNRITLNADNQIVFHYTRNNDEAPQRLTAKLKSLLSYIGCHEHLIPVDYYLGTQFAFNLAHEMGTMKFGADARTSVLDVYCRPHELENVFVTDGSFFVSAGAVNPTLTIVAQTLRVADFIKREVW
ncbi:MAG: GMC family oxidoreductase [Chloroflexi bacterium]|nr:GMC family oxidoreductase [Chloroflexota bacterium]MCI0580581.1 GMC family oxidoreductase [Chloroflexota bacterium]MCI0644449.1 GMC family oxidoreductase [Chloroflexota bacterium]MCI0728176.1 GMC family oxidoreductase [Chloroflexota bacterium]